MILIEKLFSELAARGIRYCHWKSNASLPAALKGEGDLDILVHADDSPRLAALITELGFIKAMEGALDAAPHVSHWYGHDGQNRSLAHLHIYERLVTGGAILKNHLLGIEGMLLEGCGNISGVRVPSREAELIVLLVRKSLEMASLIERRLLRKDLACLRAELDWLCRDLDKNKFDALRSRWIAHVPGELLHKTMSALQKGRLEPALGLAMTGYFPHTLRSALAASVMRGVLYAKAVLAYRMSLRWGKRRTRTGGRIIAFIGPEASGKSTLARQTVAWLDQGFDVLYLHLGKPPMTWATRFPWLLIRCYSEIKRKSSALTVLPGGSGQARRDYRPHPVVALIDAYERRALLKRCLMMARKGTIIITDRYPSRDPGGVDCPRIEPTGIWTACLAWLERKCYQSNPNPDMVVKVTVPLEITLKRNAGRPNHEPEEFLIARYPLATATQVPAARTLKVSNTETFERTFADVQTAVWELLRQADGRGEAKPMSFKGAALRTFLSNLVMAFSALAVGALTARLLSVRDRGLYAVFFTTAGLSQNLLSLGLSQSAVYYINKEKDSLGRILGNNLLIIAAMAVFLGISGWMFKDAISERILGLQDASFILWLSLLALVMIADDLLGGIARGKQRYELFADNLSFQALSALAATSLLLVFSPSLRLAVGARVLALMLVLIYYVRRIMVKIRLPAPAVDIALLGRQVIYGSKNYIQNIIGNLNARIYLYVLMAFWDARAAAQFSIALLLADGLRILPTAMTSVLFPKLTTFKDDGESQRFTGLILRHSALVTFSGAALLFISAEPIIILIFKKAYLPACPALRIMLLGASFMPFYQILTSYFSSRHEQIFSIVSAAAGFLAGLGVALWLTPALGILGAAAAFSCGTGVAGALMLGFFIYRAKIKLGQLLLPTREDFSIYSKFMKAT